MPENNVRIVSVLSSTSQTALPREVSERLGVRPGDRLLYIFDSQGVRLEKDAAPEAGDPFIAFSEWASEEDEEAYGDL